MQIELVPIHQLKEFEDNPKLPIGAQYKTALDKSIETFEFKGTLILTPRCNHEAPALAERYGADGKFILADGNQRIGRLAEAGYRWVLLLPGAHSSTGGTEALLDALEASAAEARELIRENVGPNEKTAIGTVYADLDTPERLQRFVLAYDRSRAPYDEGRVQHLMRELIEVGCDAKELQDLAAVRIAGLADLLAKQQSEAQADDGSKEAAQSLKRQLTAMIGPFSLTMEQHGMYEELLDAFRSTMPASVLKIMELAVALGVEDDLAFGIAAERAWAMHQRARV